MTPAAFTYGYAAPFIRSLTEDVDEAADVSRLRHVRGSDGSLVFLPFRAQQFRRDVHEARYHCAATNNIGTVVSAQVHATPVTTGGTKVLFRKKMASSSTAATIPSDSPPLKSPQTIFKKLHNQKLSKQTKQVVYNVYAQVKLTQSGLPVVSAFRSVSQLKGVSERMVAWLKNEVLRGTPKSPKRKRLSSSTGKPPAVTGKTRVQRYGSFALGALRRKVHQYFIRNEAPNEEKILSDVTSDPDMGLLKRGVRTMRRLLNDIGFAFRKRKRNSALLEREDIIVWWRKYLRTIREMRKQKRVLCMTLFANVHLWIGAHVLSVPESTTQGAALVVAAASATGALVGFVAKGHILGEFGR
ncbi:uncharacterized protein LOC144175415 [Haemaphysalis longicornis]